jgi:hypothetical protein
MEMSGQLHAQASLTPGIKVPNTHWIGGWVCPKSWSAKRKNPIIVSAVYRACQKHLTVFEMK